MNKYSPRNNFLLHFGPFSIHVCAHAFCGLFFFFYSWVRKVKIGIWLECAVKGALSAKSFQYSSSSEKKNPFEKCTRNAYGAHILPIRWHWPLHACHKINLILNKINHLAVHRIRVMNEHVMYSPSYLLSNHFTNVPSTNGKTPNTQNSANDGIGCATKITLLPRYRRCRRQDSVLNNLETIFLSYSLGFLFFCSFFSNNYLNAFTGLPICERWPIDFRPIGSTPIKYRKPALFTIPETTSKRRTQFHESYFN